MKQIFVLVFRLLLYIYLLSNYTRQGYSKFLHEILRKNLKGEICRWCYGQNISVPNDGLTYLLIICVHVNLAFSKRVPHRIINVTWLTFAYDFPLKIIYKFYFRFTHWTKKNQECHRVIYMCPFYFSPGLVVSNGEKMLISSHKEREIWQVNLIPLHR